MTFERGVLQEIFDKGNALFMEFMLHEGLPIWINATLYENPLKVIFALQPLVYRDGKLAKLETKDSARRFIELIITKGFEYDIQDNEQSGEVMCTITPRETVPAG